jgi:2,3,4,5-tetrahydropyridine-2-carboxylate N-succinyltransferase
MADLHARVGELWRRRDEIDPEDTDAAAVIREAIDLLDRGEARVAEIVDDEVVVHEWLKQAILLLFHQARMVTQELGPFEFADKIRLKSGYEAAGVRVVPGAPARWGSFLDRGVVLMPSYVNIGARVGARSMADTWSTVGSCASWCSSWGSRSPHVPGRAGAAVAARLDAGVTPSEAAHRG